MGRSRATRASRSSEFAVLAQFLLIHSSIHDPLHGIQVSLDGIDVFVGLFMFVHSFSLLPGSEAAAVRSASPFSPKELPYLLLQPVLDCFK